MRVRNSFDLRRTPFGRQGTCVILDLDRDDVSLWLSSFREAVESLGVRGPLRDRLGASYKELAFSEDFLLELLGEMKTAAPNALSLTGFAVEPFENSLVRSRLKWAEKRVSHSEPIGQFALLTTFRTLEVTAACASEMRSYLWPEEVHMITGYEQDVIDSFLASVEKCIDELRKISV